jgi:hypothetical protein
MDPAALLGAVADKFGQRERLEKARELLGQYQKIVRRKNPPGL